MFDYPINLDITGRSCVVIGGGKIALRKVMGLVRAGAAVTVISPCLLPPLEALRQGEKIVCKQRCYRPGDLAGCFLVICAADNSEVNCQAAAEARACGALVNITDGSGGGDFALPAQVRRGDLLLTVSTAGKSPALARQIRKDLEQQYGEGYDCYLQLLEKFRAELKAGQWTSRERVLFWQQTMQREILDLVKRGELEKAEAEIRNAIGSFGFES